MPILAAIPAVVGAIGTFASSAGGGAAIGGALGAAGSIAKGVIGSRGGTPSSHQFPIPPYARALQERNAQLYALNESHVAPSFVDWLASGGKATFPFEDPGLTPKQARQFGLVGSQGQPIPFVDPSQTKLTDAQKFYLGYQMNQLKGKKDSPLATAFRRGVHQGKGSNLGELYTGQDPSRWNR